MSGNHSGHTGMRRSDATREKMRKAHLNKKHTERTKQKIRASNHLRSLRNQSEARTAEIDYTNWRGERSVRRISPIGIRFASNEWHPRRQWLLDALDIESGEVRSFAIVGIHSWKAPT